MISPETAAATNTAMVLSRSPTVPGVSTVSSNAAGVYSSRYGSNAACRQSSTAAASSRLIRRTDNGFCAFIARSCSSSVAGVTSSLFLFHPDDHRIGPAKVLDPRLPLSWRVAT
jgi:hypothetical protein